MGLARFWAEDRDVGIYWVLPHWALPGLNVALWVYRAMGTLEGGMGCLMGVSSPWRGPVKGVWAEAVA